MINKIAHLGDYHIHNDKWHDRYEIGNQYIYKKLKSEKPDRILIAGDLFENFIIISNEAKVFAGNFLTKLSEIAQIIIVPGNHDIRKKMLSRQNSVETMVKLLNNNKITYFDKSGFFPDENVMWVNHSHLEKDINPWNDIQHVKEDKIYIDIWHDPINGCKTDNGFEMFKKTYRNLSDFKGDYLFAADIHKFQYLNKAKTQAYCSSTFQQTMGEDVMNHGFIIWDIINKTSEFISVPDDYKLITFRTNENFDYDNINFNDINATNKSEFRVIWKDYSSNINRLNEEKIKRYISDKWNSNIKFEKERIYTHINDSQKLTESINILDKKVQQDIFKEYLTANKYESSFIDEILKIDNIIEDRLEITNLINNIDWNIEKMWVNNFKSYKEFTLNLQDIHGIIQLNGENQQGKTTILDAITYITHGTTLATNKLGGAQREKHGDNRYINNKLKFDFCDGGMVINVSGEKYLLYRRTDRKMGKTSISSVSTTIDYYLGEEMIEENKMIGERKTETQTKLDSIIGDFDDFIRLTLTNSENLNSLISLDRATFIDSVIKDAGFGIFEIKLDIFKKYKSDLNKNRIDINLNDAEEEVKALDDLILTYETEFLNIKEQILLLDNKLKDINIERDEEIKKLNKIDDDIRQLDIETAKGKINDYSNAIETNLAKQKVNSERMLSLKKSYDKDKYESLLKMIKDIDDNILNYKLSISQDETNIEKEKSNITRVNDKIAQLKDKEIDSQKAKIIYINNDIDKISTELNSAINDKKRDISDTINSLTYEIKSIKVELKSIKEKGLSLKNQIKLLEDSKICPTCMRAYDESHQDEIDARVKELNDEIDTLFKRGKFVQKSLNDKTEELAIFEEKMLGVETSESILLLKSDVEERIKNKKLDIENINQVCSDIKKNIFDQVLDLQTNINKGLVLKETYENNILKFNDNISNIKKEIIKLGDIKSNHQTDVYLIDKDKEEVKVYDMLFQENKELSLKIDNIKLTIESAKLKIDRYYDQLKFIEENDRINEKIESFNALISENNNLKNELNDELGENLKESSVAKETINNIKNNIELYVAQVKQDEILKEYMRCVSRDGIPSYLLQKSRDMINTEISDMLTNVDFNVFFDESLNLKMYMKNDTKQAIINVLEGSGMERTFTAVALKMALRTINNKSRPNLLLLDEIMGKLKGDSVDKFNFLLNSLKTKIDKIFIIEHTHNIDYDILISVEKDINGVSSLTID